MKELKLLIVEDTEDLILSYERDIKSYNLASDVKISALIVKEKDQAISILKDKVQYFDAAIVDLKLDKNGLPDEDYSGNEVLREIKGNLRFPVFIITGTPNQLAEDIRKENSFFKLKPRGEEDNYLEQLVQIYDTGITQILGKKGEVEKYLNDIFWNHLSTSIDVWINDKSRTSKEKEKALLRYTLLHMQEYIDEDIEKYHPNEFYITPPVKAELFTGDIVEYRNQRCLVLTPACDFSQKNADNVLFINIKDWDSLDSEFSKRPLSNSKQTKLKELITNKKPRYHFIPKVDPIDAGFIDFQQKTAIDFNIVKERITKGIVKRVATISNPFLKDIISRYSNYLSRQGSPDFNTDEILNSLL